jgi:NitT/TauT family transport system permease protein
VSAVAILSPDAPAGTWSLLRESRAVAILAIVLALIVIWYAGAIWKNGNIIHDMDVRDGKTRSSAELVIASLTQPKPFVPAPQQVLVDTIQSTLFANPTKPSTLIFHAWVTLTSALAGFAAGTLLGILLAVAIINVKSLDKGLMPWIISSQMVPILAIAPIVIVVLGRIGITGLAPKAVISMYLSFFPVTVGMVKGLRSPTPINLDLMRTYSANAAQTLWKLRLPSSVPFFFASAKIAIAASVVGAIVAELPTGAVAGLGARLLIGTYYGQTIQMWSALVAGSIMAAGLVGIVGMLERALGRVAGRPA